ncbi:Protein of unknown function [Bacillus cereus]|nr:Protein of unknown function [Bacillus cereus]SCN31003.1 Protein of unknown function [Bacillus wiedmannii]
MNKHELKLHFINGVAQGRFWNR